MSYLPLDVCRRDHVLFTSRCLQEGSCLIYLQMFVGGIMSYLPLDVCRRDHVLLTSRCLQEGSCLIYLQMFVGGIMSYLPLDVCRRDHVLFTSRCLQEGSCLIYIICVCLFIVVSNAYIVFCFCLVCLRLVYPMLPGSLDCFCFVCLRLVYPMLPVSLDCSFLIDRFYNGKASYGGDRKVVSNSENCGNSGIIDTLTNIYMTTNCPGCVQALQ